MIDKLSFRSIHLKKMSGEDYHVLYQYRNSQSFIQSCTNRDVLLSLEDFQIELKKDFERDRYEQYLIYKDSLCIGTIFSYSYSSNDSYLFITTYIENPSKYRGAGVLAFYILCKHYFTTLGLYKVYIDIYSFNKPSLNIFSNLKLRIEGLFHQQRLIGDNRYDVFRFAIYESDFERINFNT